MERSATAAIRQPRVLRAEPRLGVFAPAAHAKEVETKAGLAELARLGVVVESTAGNSAEGYFASSAKERRAEFLRTLTDLHVDGLIGLRGGCGSNYLLDEPLVEKLE